MNPFPNNKELKIIMDKCLKSTGDLLFIIIINFCLFVCFGGWVGGGVPGDFWPLCHRIDFGLVSWQQQDQAEQMHSQPRRELHRSVS